MVYSPHTRRALVGLGLLVGITLAAGIANTATADQSCVPHWQPFTSGGQVGVGPSPNSSIVWNGDLIAGGLFTTAGGQTVNGIARWDGSEWHPFTSGGQIGVGGSSNDVRALTEWNGDLIAGGSFFDAGGQTVNHIARWDGSEWHPFISGGEIGVGPVIPPGRVNALTVYNGDLIAGGTLVTAGDQTVNHIARWDGSAWHPFTSGGQIGLGASGLPNVHALTVWNGDLIAGGTFTTAGGQTVNRIARWDGSAWQPFTSGGQIGVNSNVVALTVWNGDLIAGGNFTTAGGQTVNRIARWDGSEWHPFTSGGQIGVSNSVRAVTVWNGDLIAGGNFFTAGGETVSNIARWNGYSWQPLVVGVVGCDPVGVGGVVDALQVYDGDPVVLGTFLEAGGQTVNRIATWKACPHRGPCCVNGTILQVFADECAGAGGVFHGEEVPPDDVECAPACPGDLTGDGLVNVFDLLDLLAAWGACDN